MKTLHTGARRWALAIVMMAAASQAAHAQEADLSKIHLTTGPAKVNLGSNATLQVPKDYQFAGPADTATLLAANHNFPHGELGMLLPPEKSDEDWFIIFRFDDMGYVKDNETLDEGTISKIFMGIKDGTEEANKERRSKGWPVMNLDGWEQKPFYDAVTHSLTWAIKGHSDNGTSINYDARVLGRRGVMNCKMVLSPGELAAAVPQFQSVVTSMAFTPGETYAEFRSGDKVAEYGLVALIAGGGAVAAVKFAKPLIALGAVIVAGIASVFRKIKNFFTGNRSQG